MSGSENGGSNNTEQRKVVNPGRVLGARSASPAKRSAADMEDGVAGDISHVPGSFVKEQDDSPSAFDHAMADINPASNDAIDTQATAMDSADTSARGSMTTDTTATSFQSDAPPPYSAKDAQQSPQAGIDTPAIDEQVAKVHELASNSALDEGTAGYIISSKWLSRVLSRSTDGLESSEYPKEAREGSIGPVDNSDIVPAGAFTEPILKDTESQHFIPLKPGLSRQEDFEVLPYQAWDLIVGWYGNTLGQKPIIRYAHNTAPEEALTANIQYEYYPPIITVRKVPQPSQEAEQPSASPKSSVTELRLKDERRARGQLSPDDAIQFVSARTERFKTFLKRSKEAANIRMDCKVRIWKLLDPSKVAVDAPDNRQNGVLSPPESRPTSPKDAQASETKLVLDLEAFNKMEVGKDLEWIDAKDETNNSSYNGKSTMELYQLFEDTTIALEEHTGGPAGGEYASESKKLSARFSSLGKKSAGSKPGSTTASGRTSPAPGMMTRGRQRRDGRTRGTLGLTNLGNTCYMNSALQCIRSVEELAIYFLSGKYKAEINSSNPLGHGGAMAKQYANVLSMIYTEGASSSVTPSAFKKIIGSIQPMFSGYGQQDSQEFLSFLVDALHEDLNRIIKKPYNENPDSDDKTVHDPEAIIKLGEVYRANHKARNDSVAMDLFSGFYKNTMECPVCDKISITFDPYSLLTVQLPIENTFQHAVTFVPIRGKPVNHAIDIDKNSTIKSLKEYVASRHPGVLANRLWMAEVYSHKIYKVFDDSTTLAEAGIQGNDYLFVFELDGVPTNPPQPAKKSSYYTTSYWNPKTDEKVPEMDDPKADFFAVPIFSRQKGRFNGWENLNHPLYITLTREEAQDFEVIMKKILIAVSQMTSRPILMEHDSDRRDKLMGNEDMKDESAAEDNAQVSDRSVPSEDGYVDVSIGKSDQAVQTNGVSAADEKDDDRIPPRFMQPDYPIPNALRNSLFGVNYASSESGMHCSSMASFRDTSVRNMWDRVKIPVRRASVQSSSSERSTTSTGSGAQVDDESDESDADTEMNPPDIVLGEHSATSTTGGESYLSMPSATVDDSENESLPERALDPLISRKGRRKRGKRGKGKGGKIKTYGRKGKQGSHQNRPNSAGSLNSNHSNRPFDGLPNGEDENTYYIKLGEGIVLDWFPEAVDSLFGAKDDDDDDDAGRGYFLSSQDGRGLPFADDPEVEARKSRRETRKKNGVTLDDCFSETGKREVLSEDNAWYCSRCKELRRATKTLEIWTIPDILVVHLKRFGGNRSFRDKIDVLVDYPIEGLDMTKRIGLREDGQEYIYDLFAVDNHFGGLGGGHYTAMAKNFYDGQWYDYNDSSCSKISGENRLHSAAAYLLFYRRRSEMPLGPPDLQQIVLDARNPPETAGDEMTDGLESGEGKLGGPNGCLGSSSALIGAGAGVASLRGGSGGAGAGTPASNSLMWKTSLGEHAIGVINGAPVYGPRRPVELPGSTAEWSFSNLDNDTADNAQTLLHHADSPQQGLEIYSDDAASTTAEMDNNDEYAYGYDGAHELGTNSHWSTAGRNTPIDSDDDLASWRADMYPDAHDNQDADLGVLHLEDAGRIGDELYEDAPTANIYPSELPATMDRDKMD